jgi:hypothetical protein
LADLAHDPISTHSSLPRGTCRCNLLQHQARWKGVNEPQRRRDAEEEEEKEEKYFLFSSASLRFKFASGGINLTRLTSEFGHHV